MRQNQTSFKKKFEINFKDIKMFLTRREFLKISALSACTLVISTGLSGCGESDDDTKVAFLHGVASGDPLADKVIIWTRATTDAPSVDVVYEVSSDSAFKNILHNGSVKTDATTDFTLKIDVQNLQAGTMYYYRFKSNGTTSAIG